MDIDNSEEWITSRGFQFIGDDFRDSEYIKIKKDMVRTIFSCSVSCKIRFSLSSLIVDCISGGNCLFWASKWDSIYYKEMVDFEKFRSEEGLDLLNYPSTLFNVSSEKEKSILKIYVFLFICLNWEAYIISSNSEFIVWISDEIIEIWSKSLLDDNFIENLTEMGIKFM